MNHFYLMESETESERLRIKSNCDKTREQLMASGIMLIGENPQVVDAGSGIGHVAEVMGDLLKNQFVFPKITLLDHSERRLAAARLRLGRDQEVDYQYVSCDLKNIPLESHFADYVFCRFVFEYLSNPQAVFDELIRLLKPGGKLVIGDLDYNCMTHYPLEADLEKDLGYVMKTLQENQFFDPFIGRKLYSFFHYAGLNEVKVHFYAHHLFYGALSDADEFNWLAKLDQLIELQRKGTVQFDIDLYFFKTRVHEFLKLPSRFSYTPLILVEGKRQHDRI